jgi:hypothetical protein
MSLMDRLIPPFKFNRGEDREKVELRNRVATLEIQAGRLKEERDEAIRVRNALATKLNLARATLGVPT